MNRHKQAVRAAFPLTIPVMLGYLFVGIAFGVLLENEGFNFWWALLMCVVVYSGSMQFVAINFLSGGISIVGIILLSLMVNFRHLFYGISLIEKFNNMGKKKLYMMYSLTDETYSLLCSTNASKGIDKSLFLFYISFLNQMYWIVGSVVGALAGSIITFNTTGIDFAMTALFIVIFVEQWLSYSTHIPALVGIASALLCFITFGQNNLVLPAMILIVIVLMASRKTTEKKLNDQAEKEIVV